MTEHQDAFKHIIDGISIATAFGTLVNMLPAVAAVLSIIWSVIRIWESKTVQDWLNKDAKQQ